jgi:uncharacterized protein DUF4440
MDLSRRDVMVAGAFAFGASSLLLGGSAPASDEAEVAQSVESLRKAQLEADRAGLAKVTSEHVSYGRSDGRVQNKDEFIQGVVTRKQVVKSLTFPDLKLSVVGNAAIVRHISCPSRSWTARPRRRASAPSRSGTRRTARGSCWRARGSGCRRRSSGAPVLQRVHFVAGLGPFAAPGAVRPRDRGSTGAVRSSLDPAVSAPDFGALHPGPLSKPVALHSWM